MSTPHNQANPGEIAKTVLMPGDPLRAKFIAENWLEGPKQVNAVRGMYAYTGGYQGKQITVMGSGMGMPSIGIYSYELYQCYDVGSIIRIGSAGAYTDDLKLFDVVLAGECFSESTFGKTQNGATEDRKYPSKDLNHIIKAAALRLEIPVTEACVHSTDVFYTEPNVDGYREISAKYGCQCVEMESFALFHNANALGRQAACLLTISDSFTSSEKATPEQRQQSFTDMVQVALEAAREVKA